MSSSHRVLLPLNDFGCGPIICTNWGISAETWMKTQTKSVEGKRTSKIECNYRHKFGESLECAEQMLFARFFTEELEQCHCQLNGDVVKYLKCWKMSMELQLQYLCQVFKWSLFCSSFECLIYFCIVLKHKWFNEWCSQLSVSLCESECVCVKYWV